MIIRVISFVKQIVKYIKSAAGKTAVILFLAIIIILSQISPSKYETRELFLSFVPTLFGIIVTVCFVQYLFDKQKSKEEKHEERRKIIRYYKVVSIVRDYYVIHYNSLFQQISDDYTNGVHIKKDTNFCEMIHLYEGNFFLNEQIQRPRIEIFYEKEEALIDSLVRMSENVEFKYYKELGETIIDIIKCSKSYDVKGIILSNHSTMLKDNSGDHRLSEYVIQQIKDSKRDYCSEYLTGKLKSSILIPYVMLYFLLKEEARLLENLQLQIKELETETV